MLFQAVFNFLGVIERLACRRSWLRLGLLRQFQAFLAAGAFPESANSYHFASVAPLPWRNAFSQFALVIKLGFPVLASGSNISSQPTAYGGV